jgi:hypothetical protein
MATTLPPRPPLVRCSSVGTAAPHENFTPASHVNASDFVTLNGLSQIASSGANAALIAGLAEHDSNSNYGGQAPPPALQNTSLVLGASNVGLGGLVSPSPKQTIVVTLGPNMGVEMSLTAATFWQVGAGVATAFATVAGVFVAGNTITTTINGHAVVYTVTGLEGSNQAIAAAVAAQLLADPIIAATAVPSAPGGGVSFLTAVIGGTVGNAITITTANTGAGTYIASGATFTGGTGVDAYIGSLVGLAVDPTTGYYLADPLASNKIGRIFAKPVAPNGLFGGGAGTVGDLGARVLVEFLPAALQLSQGE